MCLHASLTSNRLIISTSCIRAYCPVERCSRNTINVHIYDLFICMHAAEHTPKSNNILNSITHTHTRTHVHGCGARSHAHSHLATASDCILFAQHSPNNMRCRCRLPSARASSIKIYASRSYLFRPSSIEFIARYVCTLAVAVAADAVLPVGADGRVES